MTTNTTTVQIRHVPSELHHAAKLAALMAGQSLNAWLIEAIKKALENKGKPIVDPMTGHYGPDGVGR